MSILRNAVSDRLNGGRSSAPRAAIAAVTAGLLAATITYRALRA